MIRKSIEFAVRIDQGVADVQGADWDALGTGLPFQSRRWYAYGERVMADCQPIYITLSQGEREVARGTFWLVRNEPLPLPRPFQGVTAALFQRWPLLISRAPLAYASGLVLPEPPLRRSALQALAAAGLEEARRLHAAFLIFDFIGEEQTGWDGWPAEWKHLQISDPGTSLDIRWPNFEAFLAGLSRNEHRHYQRSMRAVGELGIRILRRVSVDDLRSAIELVLNVERRYRNIPNPWAGGLMAHLALVDGTWLAAYIGDELVGTEIALRDGDVQIHAALGLKQGLPHLYFALGYEGIRLAIEQGVRTLRWGSGAYDFKQRLGFHLERNNHIMLAGTGSVSRLVARLAAG